jgi:hypothetical protein
MAYESGFDLDFKDRIKCWLQYQKPDHFHDEPYDLKDFHSCAYFLLASTIAATQITAQPATWNTIPRTQNYSRIYSVMG